MRNLFLHVALLATIFLGITSCENFEDDYLAAQEQIVALEGQLEAVLAQSKKDAEKIENLNSEVNTLEDELSVVKTALNESEEVSDELRETISTLEARIIELEAELAAAHDEIDLLKSDIESLNSQLDANQISVAEYAEQIAELEEDLAVAEAKVEEIEEEVVEVVEEVQQVVPAPAVTPAETPADDSEADADADDVVACNATEFEAIDVTFDEDDYLVIPGSDYSVGTQTFTQTVTKTVCTDGVASVVSTTYKLEVITAKLGSNTESGWGFDKSQNDDDDLIDNVDKVEITLKFYVDGDEDEDLETSADWFVVVKDNTEAKVCEVVTYTVNDAKTWVEGLLTPADGAVGSFSKDFTNVASDCTETVKTSNANVIKSSLNYSELAHGEDYNGDGDMNDTVKLEWFLASWSFDGTTYQLAGEKYYVETITDVDGETVNADIYLKGSHIYTKSTNTADDGTLTLTHVISDASKRMDGISATASVQINGVGTPWSWQSSKTHSGVTLTATVDSVTDELTITIAFDVDEATDVSISFVAE